MAAMVDAFHEGAFGGTRPPLCPRGHDETRDPPRIGRMDVGTLFYGARFSVTIDDRTLAHLKVVTTMKLRRGEGFLLSWTEPPGNGSGRGSFWVHPYCDMYFKFDGGRAPELDRELLDQMAVATSGNTGLHIDAALERAGR
jgi:hypothetical protein